MSYFVVGRLDRLNSPAYDLSLVNKSLGDREMIKLVLAMIAVVTVACGEDKKDPYSPFDNDHWLSSDSCSALERSRVAGLWSELAELDESEREKLPDEYYEYYERSETPEEADRWYKLVSCLDWLNENAEWSN